MKSVGGSLAVGSYFLRGSDPIFGKKAKRQKSLGTSNVNPLNTAINTSFNWLLRKLLSRLFPGSCMTQRTCMKLSFPSAIFKTRPWHEFSMCGSAR